MSRYPYIEVIITEKDADPLKIILKTASTLARHQIPSWIRMEFMEKALETNGVEALKKVCNAYVTLKNGSKTLVF